MFHLEIQPLVKPANPRMLTKARTTSISKVFPELKSYTFNHNTASGDFAGGMH